jgi:hypothetical protein
MRTNLEKNVEEEDDEYDHQQQFLQFFLCPFSDKSESWLRYSLTSSTTYLECK